MKLKSVEIKHFNSIGAVKAMPALYNVLCGPNGSGKSTFIEAVRFAITGKPPHEPVENGHEECMVCVNLEDVGRIERRIRSTGAKAKSEVKVNGRTTSGVSVSESIQALSNVSQQTSNVLTSSELLEGMSHADFGAFLLDQGFFKGRGRY